LTRLHIKKSPATNDRAIGRLWNTARSEALQLSKMPLVEIDAGDGVGTLFVIHAADLPYLSLDVGAATIDHLVVSV
jgi:hypothetical protein